MLVEAQTWPDQRRHWSQWQASPGFRSPSTSKLIAPQRQAPLCMIFSFLLWSGRGRRRAEALRQRLLDAAGRDARGDGRQVRPPTGPPPARQIQSIIGQLLVDA